MKFVLQATSSNCHSLTAPSPLQTSAATSTSEIFSWGPDDAFAGCPSATPFDGFEFPGCSSLTQPLSTNLGFDYDLLGVDSLGWLRDVGQGRKAMAANWSTGCKVCQHSVACLLYTVTVVSALSHLRFIFSVGSTVHAPPRPLTCFISRSGILIFVSRTYTICHSGSPPVVMHRSQYISHDILPTILQYHLLRPTVSLSKISAPLFSLTCVASAHHPPLSPLHSPPETAGWRIGYSSQI